MSRKPKKKNIPKEMILRDIKAIEENRDGDVKLPLAILRKEEPLLYRKAYKKSYAKIHNKDPKVKKLKKDYMKIYQKTDKYKESRQKTKERPGQKEYYQKYYKAYQKALSTLRDKYYAEFKILFEGFKKEMKK